jgi:hypothetical protein
MKEQRPCPVVLGHQGEGAFLLQWVWMNSPRGLGSGVGRNGGRKPGEELEVRLRRGERLPPPQIKEAKLGGIGEDLGVGCETWVRMTLAQAPGIAGRHRIAQSWSWWA